jgi:hypothetical protein
MKHRSALRLYAAAFVAILAAAPASAQFVPRPLEEPAVGERYHIEASAGFWSPAAAMAISSESLGIPGDMIDFKKDLGLQDRRFNELHLVLRPARIHKLRFQYIPIRYEQSATLTRSIVFNGQRYTVGIPVNSSLHWKAYRFSYEADVVTRDRWFAGFILDAKYTDVSAALATPILSEAARAQAPIPAVGGIGRVYVAPNISITGETTIFNLGWLPESLVEDSQGHYVDIDVYGTVNFTNNIGAQIGYRKFDLGYLVEKDTGSFVLKGLYFGVVARY